MNGGNGSCTLKYRRSARTSSEPTGTVARRRKTDISAAVSVSELRNW
jgi:hypothetical protein